MPFVSKKQMKLCYILQKQGKNKNWDCHEWSEKTDYSSLPEYVPLKSKSRSKSRSRSKLRSKKRSKNKGRSKSRSKKEGLYKK